RRAVERQRRARRPVEALLRDRASLEGRLDTAVTQPATVGELGGESSRLRQRALEQQVRDAALVRGQLDDDALILAGQVGAELELALALGLDVRIAERRWAIVGAADHDAGVSVDV